MPEFVRFVLFRLDAQRYGLPLPAVERIVRAVEVTPLPDGPAIVLGIINVAGTILPVLDIRKRFGHLTREIQLTDQFIIARTSRRRVVLMVDEAQEIIRYPQAEIVRASGVVPGVEKIDGVAKLESGLALIHDLEKFLSLDEAAALDDAIKREVTRAG